MYNKTHSIILHSIVLKLFFFVLDVGP